jgi:hypothetical protein
MENNRQFFSPSGQKVHGLDIVEPASQPQQPNCLISFSFPRSSKSHWASIWSFGPSWIIIQSSPTQVTSHAHYLTHSLKIPNPLPQRKEKVKRSLVSRNRWVPLPPSGVRHRHSVVFLPSRCRAPEPTSSGFQFPNGDGDDDDATRGGARRPPHPGGILLVLPHRPYPPRTPPHVTLPTSTFILFAVS